jgi:hypothetical protein
MIEKTGLGLAGIWYLKTLRNGNLRPSTKT